MSVCLACSLLVGLSLRTWRKGKAQPSPEDPPDCFCNKTWTFAPSPGSRAGSVTQTPTRASASPSHVQFPSKLSDRMKRPLHNKQLGPCPTQGHLWMQIAVYLTLRPSNPLHTCPTLSSGPGWDPAAAGSTPSLCQVATPGHTTYVQIAPLNLHVYLTREELALSPLAQQEGIRPHIKLPMAFFTELEQKISQFVWEHRRPQRAKAVLRERRMELEKSTYLISGIYCKAIGYATELQSSRQYGAGTETED